MGNLPGLHENDISFVDIGSQSISKERRSETRCWWWSRDGRSSWLLLIVVCLTCARSLFLLPLSSFFLRLSFFLLRVRHVHSWALLYPFREKVPAMRARRGKTSSLLFGARDATFDRLFLYSGVRGSYLPTRKE